ncbi:MAG TPA: uracil-DNA glycosylase [Thermomicrobiales bacterium]|nr:uracil-DNA glycosylase [Thermomicrobiales bacterium]
MEKSERIRIIEEVATLVRACGRCELCRGRTNAVPGQGDYETDIMFIGEAPGANEDRQGLPFVGASGQFLNELIAAAGFQRESVFITNIVKCRPPGNRDPLPDEIAACQPYLDSQIEAIDPLAIVTLGRFSMSRWFPNERISRIHGQPRRFGERVVVPMYHPAAALHQSSLRATIESDFQKLPRVVAEARERRTEAPAPPVQSRLF